MWHYVNEFAFPTYWRIVVASSSRLEESRRHYVCLKFLLVNSNPVLSHHSLADLYHHQHLHSNHNITISLILTQRTSNKNMSKCKLNLWILEELQSCEVLIMLVFVMQVTSSFQISPFSDAYILTPLPLPNIISRFYTGWCMKSLQSLLISPNPSLSISCQLFPFLLMSSSTWLHHFSGSSYTSLMF